MGVRLQGNFGYIFLSAALHSMFLRDQPNESRLRSRLSRLLCARVRARVRVNLAILSSHARVRVKRARAQLRRALTQS
jgi:hypothetical protein